MWLAPPAALHAVLNARGAFRLRIAPTAACIDHVLALGFDVEVDEAQEKLAGHVGLYLIHVLGCHVSFDHLRIKRTSLRTKRRISVGATATANSTDTTSMELLLDFLHSSPGTLPRHPGLELAAEVHAALQATEAKGVQVWRIMFFSGAAVG